jgi:hypothetical protein
MNFAKTILSSIAFLLFVYPPFVFLVTVNNAGTAARRAPNIRLVSVTCHAGAFYGRSPSDILPVALNQGFIVFFSEFQFYG